jgi:hypothetical protein
MFSVKESDISNQDFYNGSEINKGECKINQRKRGKVLPNAVTDLNKNRVPYKIQKIIIPSSSKILPRI